MPNLKPTTRIDIIGNLDLSPEKDPGFYLQSKQQNKYFIKPPNWDSAGADRIDLIAVQNEREYQEMLQMQDKMLENAKLQSKINTNRVQELYKSTAELRERFIEVNTFMKECDDKKRITEQKVAEEEERHAELKKVVAKYNDDNKVLTEFRDILSDIVKDFEPYEEVIKDVISKTDGWDTVRECTDRCDALMLAQADIARMEKEKLKDVESRRELMAKLSSEAALTILGFINEMSQLERDLVQARTECLKWEKVLARVKDCIAEDLLTKKRMIDGIQLMYKTLCKRRGIDPVIKRFDVEKQLDFIKNEIEILQQVVRICKDK